MRRKKNTKRDILVTTNGINTEDGCLYLSRQRLTEILEDPRRRKTIAAFRDPESGAMHYPNGFPPNAEGISNDYLIVPRKKQKFRFLGKERR